MNASAIQATRAAAVAAAIERIRAIEHSQGVTRDTLNAIMVELKALAAQQNLVPLHRIPAAARWRARQPPLSAPGRSGPPFRAVHERAEPGQ